MAPIDPQKINWREYREIKVNSINEAWSSVRRFQKVPYEGEYKDIWKCNYCDQIHTGNVARIEGHLGGVPGFTISSCSAVPSDVKERMVHAANRKKVNAEENKKRKYESGSASGIGDSHSNALQSGSSGVNSIGEEGGRTGTLHDVLAQTITPRLGNSQLNAVGDGGNISNAAHLEHPSDIASTAITHESLPSQPPISQQLAGSGAVGPQAFLGSSHGLGFTGSGHSRFIPGAPYNSGVPAVHPDRCVGSEGVEAVASDQLFLAWQDQQQNNGAIENLGTSGESDGVDWSQFLSGMLQPPFHPYPPTLAGFPVSNHGLGFDGSGNSGNSACQPQISRTAEADPVSAVNTNTAYGSVGPQGVETGGGGLDSNTRWRQRGFPESSHWQSFTGSAKSRRSANISGVVVDGHPSVTDYLASVVRENMAKFIEIYSGFGLRIDDVRNQKNWLEEMSGSTTRKREETDEWLKSAKPVRKRSADLLVKIGFSQEQVKHLPNTGFSPEQVRWVAGDHLAKICNKWEQHAQQHDEPLEKVRKFMVTEIEDLLEMMGKLGREMEELMDKSKDLLAVKTTMEFMNCRWEGSLKVRFEETLPMQSA